VTLLMLLVALVLFPQVDAPTVGQPGKDVVWAPTPDPLVDRMLDMAGVGPDDYVIDLGSGDGRIVIQAALKYGAKGVGIEYNPDMVAVSREKASEAGVADKVHFVQGDIFLSDFSEATVVTMYLLPELNLRLRDTLLAMRPGTRVASYYFDMADWAADQSFMVMGYTAYLWVVPVAVAGEWSLTDETGKTMELRLEQSFQMLSGSVCIGGGKWIALEDGRVLGDRFRASFTDESSELEIWASVEGTKLSGTLRSGVDTVIGLTGEMRTP
jgi:SAM-dependent methyltransferase